MRTDPLFPLTFGYSHFIKTEFKKGNLPTVKKGFYGEPIDKDTVTIEHLQLASSFKDKRQATTTGNIVLTSANKNMERGCRPLSEVINYKAIGEYFAQFEKYSWGKDYIIKCMKTITNLLEKGL